MTTATLNLMIILNLQVTTSQYLEIYLTKIIDVCLCHWPLLAAESFDQGLNA